MASLLELSPEILIIIAEKLDRHDSLPNFRLACKALNRAAEKHAYRNLVLSLDEEVSPTTLSWKEKLCHPPPQFTGAKHLTILNKCLNSSGFYFRWPVCRKSTNRILRWDLLEDAAQDASEQFWRSAFISGVQFFWDVKLSADQLESFRWRHATALSLAAFTKMVTHHANSLANLEVSMIKPPLQDDVMAFEQSVSLKDFPRLRSLTYNGLSHTEPVITPAEPGGRFRMLRGLFRKIYPSLRELTLSQNHCISQIGKTPLVNGRTWADLLCDIDELYYDPSNSDTPFHDPIQLELAKLELGGFKLAMFGTTIFNSLPTIHSRPRMRINISALRRLVLNDCDSVAQLLQHMQTRGNEVGLQEFGLQVLENEDALEDYVQLKNTLRPFLLSFKGLTLLSILWHVEADTETESLISAEDQAAIVQHHAGTLQAYNLEYRADGSDIFDRYLPFAVEPLMTPPTWRYHQPAVRPQLRELSLHASFTDAFQNLKMLSQYPHLRTVHIRNFPRLPSNHSINDYWSDTRGVVTTKAMQIAEDWAQAIALPFYGSVGYDLVDDAKLLSEEHTKARDNLLGAKLSLLFRSSTPCFDLLSRVLQLRADLDFEFADLLRRIKARPCEAYWWEQRAFEEYEATVKRCLGLSPPNGYAAPELRLLIVGDWRYRDQMNLCGPRTWDPRAWSVDRVVDKAGRMRYPPGQGLDDEDEHDADDDVDAANGIKLRSGCHMETDVAHRPIFFSIEWTPMQESSAAKRWKWKAKATPLEQTTLEGYGALLDVRLLDFAWQN